MAQLVAYNDTTAPTLPSNLGAESDISAARRVGPLVREAGDAVSSGLGALGKAAGDILQQREDAATQQQVSGAHLQLGQMMAADSQGLQTAFAGADPSKYGDIGRQYIQDNVIPAGQKFVDQFTTPAGRKWAEAALGEYHEHLVQKVASDATIAAGAGAVIDADQALNTFAGNALKDPSTIDMNVAAWKAGIEGRKLNPLLDAQQRARLDEFTQKGAGTIAAAGIKSAIERDPQTGLNLLNDTLTKNPTWLTGQAATELQAHASLSARANLAQQRADAEEYRRAVKEDFNQKEAQLYASTEGPNGVQMPPDYFQQAARLAFHPGAAQSPGAVEAAIKFGNYQILNAARDAPVPTNPSTYNDFNARQFLPPDDPNRLTLQQVAQAQTDRQLNEKDAGMFRQHLDDFSKNPQLADDQKQLTTFLKGQVPTGMVTNPQQSQALSQAERDKTDRFWAGRRSGLAPGDLLDQNSKNFIGNISPDQWQNAAVEPTQAPLNAMQGRLAAAVDTAIQATNLVNSNGPGAAKEILHKGGIDVDPTNAWCAPLVNAALKQVGIDPSVDNTAASFKNWGFPVTAQQVQKGDVFYVPAEGYTGHVGFATGRIKSSGSNTLVEVVSSHKQGSGTDGGIEWRNAAGMVFRRAKPPLEDIKPGMVSRFFSYWHGVGPDQTTPAQPGEE